MEDADKSVDTPVQGPAVPGDSQAQAPEPAADLGEVLKAIQSAVTGEFCSAISHSLQSPLSARVIGVSSGTLAEFAASVEEPSCCLRVVAGAANGAEAAGSSSPPAWMEISPQVAYPILDRLLGGTGRECYVPNRPLTAIERKLLWRVAEEAIGCIGRSWRSASLAIAGGSIAPAAIPPAEAPEDVLVLKFTLALGRHAGAMRLCLARRLLPAAAPEDQYLAGEDRGAHAPAGSPLELSVVVQDPAVTAEELAELGKGDILVTDADADGEVIVRVAGIPKFYARLGASNGRRAIRITRRIE